VDRLVGQIARLTGESKTETVRRALAERLLRLGQRGALVGRATRVAEFLRSEVWPLLPDKAGAGREDAGHEDAGREDAGREPSISQLVIRELGFDDEGLW